MSCNIIFHTNDQTKAQNSFRVQCEEFKGKLHPQISFSKCFYKKRVFRSCRAAPLTCSRPCCTAMFLQKPTTDKQAAARPNVFCVTHKFHSIVGSSAASPLDVTKSYMLHFSSVLPKNRRNMNVGNKFHRNPSTSCFLMVALEEKTEGCQN